MSKRYISSIRILPIWIYIYIYIQVSLSWWNIDGISRDWFLVSILLNEYLYYIWRPIYDFQHMIHTYPSDTSMRSSTLILLSDDYQGIDLLFDIDRNIQSLYIHWFSNVVLNDMSLKERDSANTYTNLFDTNFAFNSQYKWLIDSVSTTSRNTKFLQQIHIDPVQSHISPIDPNQFPNVLGGIFQYISYVYPTSKLDIRSQIPLFSYEKLISDILVLENLHRSDTDNVVT